MSKGKKIFILVSMVLLLVVTGYLNVALNKKESGVETTTTTANFFTTCRADKISARNYRIEICNSIINSSASQEQIDSAIAEVNAIQARIEEELALETVVASKGYEDVLVKLGDDNMDVYVKTNAGLTFDEASSILALLTRETNMLATQIRVFPIY